MVFTFFPFNSLPFFPFPLIWFFCSGQRHISFNLIFIRKMLPSFTIVVFLVIFFILCQYGISLSLFFIESLGCIPQSFIIRTLYFLVDFKAQIWKCKKNCKTSSCTFFCVHCSNQTIRFIEKVWVSLGLKPKHIMKPYENICKFKYLKFSNYRLENIRAT